MTLLIQESENQLDVLYPNEGEAPLVKFEGDLACISFFDEGTGREVTIQIHKGNILSIANRIKDDLAASLTS
ncbi:hypothetical protein DNI29_04270 [Hymenobacter sediminis]|uniref:hypothetical protein n=1 Tax=Hymenobacter sediminis TaxID=2218621 RepID=UPI000DA640D3|nr:hypothetical protein [Hymenobacter sediminis]RPD50018.1 hypothetical protein DNI29_04270 [Hymenobacter sediminis]